MSSELRCPPYDGAVPPSHDGSILALAAIASDAVNAYRATVDERRTFAETLRAGRQLAIATQQLTTAITDAVACGDNQLS